MNPDLDKLNDMIRQDADQLLYKNGLHDLLLQYGQPHYSGSYALHLMTWRDLDIYLEANLSIENFFELGTKLATLLQPVKMSYRNERIAKTTGLPPGLYWGIYLGDERKGAWKFDIWVVDPAQCKKLLKYCDDLSKRISKENRSIIIEIKSQCWQDPGYRKTFTSSDIYKAVLDDKISTIEEFRSWRKEKRKG